MNEIKMVLINFPTRGKGCEFRTGDELSTLDEVVTATICGTALGTWHTLHCALQQPRELVGGIVSIS